MNLGLILVLSALSAFSIGAASAAAAVGTAWGGGVLSRRAALAVAAIFMALGATLSGREVTDTIGRRLLTTSMTTVDAGTVLVVVAAALSLSLLVRVPLSTSQCATAAVVGVGLVRGSVVWPVTMTVAGCWLVMPLLSYALSSTLQRYLYLPLLQAVNHRRGVGPGLKALTIACTAYLAYAAGASNAGNAAGPVVGSGILDPGRALLLAAVMMVAGTTAGGRLLPALSSDITSLCLVRSSLGVLSAATLLLICSLAGIPGAMVQLTAAAVAAAGQGQAVNSAHCRRLAAVWVGSVVAAAIAAALILAAVGR